MYSPGNCLRKIVFSITHSMNPGFFATKHQGTDPLERISMKKLVFICSPYTGDEDFGRVALQSICRFCFREEVIPLSAHLYLNSLMSRVSRYDKNIGQELSLALIQKCDEVWVFGEVSTFAMARELAHAEILNRKIRYFTREGK